MKECDFCCWRRVQITCEIVLGGSRKRPLPSAEDEPEESLVGRSDSPPRKRRTVKATPDGEVNWPFCSQENAFSSNLNGHRAHL